MIKKSTVHLFWFVNGLLGLAIGIVFLFLTSEKLIGLMVFITTWIVLNQLLILSQNGN